MLYKTQSFVPEMEDIFMLLALAFYLTMDGLYLSALPVLYQLLDFADGVAPPWATMIKDGVVERCPWYPRPDRPRHRGGARR